MPHDNSRLAALAAGGGRPSLARLIEARFDFIEQALAIGISRRQVLDALSGDIGRPIALDTFEKALYRIRKKRRQAPPDGNPGNASPGLPVPAEPGQDAPASAGQHLTPYERRLAQREKRRTMVERVADAARVNKTGGLKLIPVESKSAYTPTDNLEELPFDY